MFLDSSLPYPFKKCPWDKRPLFTFKLSPFNKGGPKNCGNMLIFDFKWSFYVPFTEKGKASFSESDGVAVLMKVLQESEDEEFVDLVFEIFSSVVVDGKLF